MGSSQSAPGLDIAMEDCTDLLRAVAIRLRLIVGVGAELPCEPDSVLECAMALGQLHKTLAYKFEITQRVKLKVRTGYALSAERACA
jgi:hypothetical protein